MHANDANNANLCIPARHIYQYFNNFFNILFTTLFFDFFFYQTISINIISLVRESEADIVLLEIFQKLLGSSP